MNDVTVSVEDEGDRMRIVIPLRWQERVFLFVATTVILGFGLAMSFIACWAIAQTELARFWWTPLILSAVIGLLYLFCALYVWFIPPSVLEFDGTDLHAGTLNNTRLQRWSSAKIKSISVLRLPLVPIGTIVIEPKIDMQVRVGYWKKRELVDVVERLCRKMKL